MKKLLFLAQVFSLIVFSLIVAVADSSNDLTTSTIQRNIENAKANWKNLINTLDKIWSKGSQKGYAIQKWREDINSDGQKETIIFGYALEDGPFATMWVKIFHPRFGKVLFLNLSDVMPCLFADIDLKSPGKEILVSNPVDYDIDENKAHPIIKVFGWQANNHTYQEYCRFQTQKAYPVFETSTTPDGTIVYDTYFRLEQFDEFLKYWVNRKTDSC